MSDADLLRRAAKLMRDRAGAATAGPWRVEDGEHVRTCDQSGRIEVWNRYEAEHIASWHPTVAVAVADWLDSEALLWEQADDLPDLAPLELRVTLSNREQSLAVARVYLGEPAGLVTTCPS